MFSNKQLERSDRIQRILAPIEKQIQTPPAAEATGCTKQTSHASIVGKFVV